MSETAIAANIDKNLRIEKNLGLVHFWARKLSQASGQQEELSSAGVLGLTKAASTFDAGRNVQFSTYASRCIKNEMLMYLRWQARTMREVPIEPMLCANGEGERPFAAERLRADQNEVSCALEAEEELLLLRKLLKSLSDRDRVLLQLRYGLEQPEGHGKSQRETAALLGISQSYLSRLERRILSRLKKKMTEGLV